MEKSVANNLNPFSSDEDVEEEEEEEEEEGEGERGKEEITYEKDIPLPSTPQAAQTEHHWQAMEKIMNGPGQLTDPFSLEELREHLSSIEKLVARERPDSTGCAGDSLEVVLSQNIVENVYIFSTRQRVHAREIRIMLLRFLTEVLARSSQPILIHQQILRPLNRLLRACEGADDPGISSALVPLLHQICILLQENQSLLDLFYVESRAHHPSRFLLMTQLIPLMHDVTEVGNRSRDALLLCLSLADQLPQSNLSRFIATDCSFCQVLATGLSALYSDLPTTCTYEVDEWQSPLPVIEASIPELKRFYQALDFCNSVLQMSPKVICDSILSLVRDGFLQQVVGPALFQTTEEAVTMAMAYLTLFLSHISNVSLMREFLRFLVKGSYDGRSVLSTIILGVSSSSVKMCSVALELLYVLVDLNCEDIMLELVFQHLLKGHHLPNQIPILARPDIYGQAAKKFLQLLPSSCITAEKMFLDSIRPPTQTPQHQSYPGTPNRVSSPPPPPLLTSSPLNSSQLEKPKPIQLSVPSKTNGIPTSTNPFDLPVTPRSRSGSNGSTGSSQTSISSSFSGGQPPNHHHHHHHHHQTMLTSSSNVEMLQFEYIPPPLSYSHNLFTAREAIRVCAARCRCWSNWYDQCKEGGGTEMVESETGSKDTKSLEMEDVGVKVEISEPVNDEKSLAKLSSFRSRSATLSSAYRLPLARSRDGSGTANVEASSRGRQKAITQGGGETEESAHSFQHVRTSPRMSRKSEDSRFEDKAGALLRVLMEKLSEMLRLPPAVNVQLTRLISRLAHYPQPLLRSLLLNHQLVLRPGVPNLFYVLQSIKINIDRHARTQEGFERRLGRARKTMIYRAHIRNAQIEESVASQIVSRLTKQASVLSQIGDSTDVATPKITGSSKHSTESAEDPLPRTAAHVEVQRTRSVHRAGSRRTKPKKVSTDTLFAIVIFDEFLKELASLAHEHSCLNPTTYQLQPPQ